MARLRSKKSTAEGSDGLAFLLSQVGAHSSSRFAEKLERLGLKPPHAGILRVIAQTDGLSQQASARSWEYSPAGWWRCSMSSKAGNSSRGGTARPTGGRMRFYLTQTGHSILEEIEQITAEHQDSLCRPLNNVERAQLTEYLRRIAAEQQLAPVFIRVFGSSIEGNGNR